MNAQKRQLSFRDPAGFVFRAEGELYRQVNAVFGEDFDYFVGSGLYDAFVADGLLVPHEVVATSLAACEGAHAVLRPETIPFISYPHEWSFTQLKDAALLTLRLMERALGRGMILRDAYAGNVQFVRGRPVFIDTLSFGRYDPGTPWQAYRQFCEQFLAPLAVQARLDARLGQLVNVHGEGLPLDLASRMLDAGSWLRAGLLTHIHLHARAAARFQATARPIPHGTFAIGDLQRLVEHLQLTIERLSPRYARSVWSEYDPCDAYSVEAMTSKVAVVRALLGELRPRLTLDLGAGVGRFARMAAEFGQLAIAADSDAAVVDRNYVAVKQEGEAGVLPLVIDAMHPSPAGGWAQAEHPSLVDRGRYDMVMALALVHHLVLTHAIPLRRVAGFLSALATTAIVEYVPPGDPQAQRLLAGGARLLHPYSLTAFEDGFGEAFAVLDRRPIADSQRVLYLLQSVKHAR